MSTADRGRPTRRWPSCTPPLSPGACLSLLGPRFNALVYVLAGRARSERRAARAGGQLVGVRPGRLDGGPGGRPPGFGTADLEVLVLGGRPIGEPVAHYGPFVMNTRDEIGQALEDFEAGRLGTVPPNALMPHVPDPDPVRAEHTGI